MTQLNDAINMAKSQIQNGYNQELFDSIYPFCNENIKELFSYFSLKDKDCLSVQASSDQIFDMHLKGAKTITTFDINPLTLHYFYLKRAGIKAGLTFEDFKEYLCFEEYENHRVNKNAFDQSVFNIIKKYLDKDAYTFWARLYNCFSAKEIREPLGLFTYDEPSHIILEKTVSYFNEDSYRELQANIDKLQIKFINANLKSLPAYLDNRYDFMYFSNIIQYADLMFKNYDNLNLEDNQKTKLMKLKNLFKYLSLYLKENGYMILGYLYEPKYVDQDVAIFNKNLRNEIFNEENYKYLYVRSPRSFISTDIIEQTNLEQDACLIYKK